MNINAITGNALQAFATGQQVTVSNIANLNSENVKASRVTYQDNGNDGVSAAVSRTRDTVSISREAADLLATTQNFKASLKVIKVADEMTKQLLSIRV